jgi:hypothetical protein
MIDRGVVLPGVKVFRRAGSGAQGQSRTADAKSFTFRLESDGRLGAELGRGKTGALQAKRWRYGEAE